MTGAWAALYGLLIMLEDRLGGKQARLLHQFIEVGEYGLALEGISGASAQDTAAITDQERTAMLALASQMAVDDLVCRALAFCPRVIPPEPVQPGLSSE